MPIEISATLLANGEHQTMGPKTLWYQFYRRASVPFGILIIALFLAIARAQNLVPAEYAGYVRTAEHIGIAIAVVVGLAAYIVAKVVHRNNTFALAEDALKIRRGFWKREEFAIPYRQVQNIEIESTLSQRMLGLSTLIILTAAQESEATRADAPESVIPAIDHDLALALQDGILKRANTQKVTQVPQAAA